MNNGARPGTGDAPLDYRFTLPFAGPDNTVSAAAMTTAIDDLLEQGLVQHQRDWEHGLLRSDGPVEKGSEERRQAMLRVLVTGGPW